MLLKMKTGSGISDQGENVHCDLPCCAQFVQKVMKPRLTMKIVVSLATLLFIVVVPLAQAFNVDVPSVLTHRGTAGSMFGFSVAQHKDSNVSWYVPSSSFIMIIRLL